MYGVRQFMTEKQENDILYICTMIEYVARKTKNHRGTIACFMGKKGIEQQLKVAEVNHSLGFEQVSDEWIEDYKIKPGNFDTVANCKYQVPSETSIGGVYTDIILQSGSEDDIAQQIMDIFTSFMSDEISNFNSNLYYTNPDYLKCSYEAGCLLA